MFPMVTIKTAEQRGTKLKLSSVGLEAKVNINWHMDIQTKWVRSIGS